MSTRVAWWIRDGPARIKGSDITPRRISRERAEELLDAATSRTNPDKKTLPNFTCEYENCDDPRDWGIMEVSKDVEP